MSKINEKKDEPLSLKVQPSLLVVLKEISEREDRPVGYVARELMVRGLGLYQQDGRVRDESILMTSDRKVK
ncbi:MAG: hypothetical protein KF855_03490 [Acidobacteria bacterium]|nr:hypothetical protein [Acidobacteriota bacterium]